MSLTKAEAQELAEQSGFTWLTTKDYGDQLHAFALKVIEAQRSQQPMESLRGGELYRHIKTDRLYEVLCNAHMEANGELVVVYMNVVTGERSVRPAQQFNDGRFLRISK